MNKSRRCVFSSVNLFFRGIQEGFTVLASMVLLWPGQNLPQQTRRKEAERRVYHISTVSVLTGVAVRPHKIWQEKGLNRLTQTFIYPARAGQESNFKSVVLTFNEALTLITLLKIADGRFDLFYNTGCEALNYSQVLSSLRCE